MEIVGYLAALAAATCWAFASLFAVGPVRALGAIPFNTLRMLIVGSLLSFWLWLSGDWVWPEPGALKALVLSGFIGIFLGDTLLFLAVKILGPRLTGLLFATNAPISFLLGIWLLEESYFLFNIIGVIAVTMGVFLAISSRSNSGEHPWEKPIGHVGLGLLAGFGAALCQSLGTLIVFDTMRAGQDPVFATMIRAWVAVLFLSLTLFIPGLNTDVKNYRLLSRNMILKITASGTLGMAVGMSLLLWAVNLAPLGIVAILSAISPVIILPAIWISTGERPSKMSLVAASIVVAGTALIFIAK